ncbi:FAD-dependent oxidoreductase [Anaerocolumna sp. MB42-C2]|uniref:FAD-dependent oxidoreductase n=1 Tax=Anaerocolumna sp. MB42-C2 TaxID=3070997 RepID=UPI0027E1E1C4|nr:FAD-dependent oxidoreductase [Anaerocolumna sp. MB42-C2]WMJ90118.1 FAD-dependent oxidoreductase [Anaerocolumna sp. MB42-C2]
MINYETQIVVIAAGPSGLAAAVQAAEDGAKVIVLEKSASVGGAANMGMGPLGIGTRYQKQQMIDITVEKAFNMFMEYTHYNVDARLVKKYFEQSADTIEWLEEMGVQFEGAFRYFPKSEATWHIVKTDHGIGPRAASFMNKALYERAVELGVQFLLETPAKKIIMKDGKVGGVIGIDKTGQEIEISCQAAIICTGGAGSNKQLIQEETGLKHGEDLFSFAIPGLTGDGMKMAWEAGAGKTQVRIEMAASIEGMEELPQGISNIFSQPNLLVNKLGKRVMNEEQMQNSTYLSNVVVHQKDKICYSIVDSSIVKHYVRNGVDNVSLVRTNPDVSDFYDGIKMAQENNNKDLYIANSIEELAQMAGIDETALIDTVDRYNDYCDSVDEEFFKDHRFLRPLIKAPYYCAKIRTGGYGTVGGIKINENCEAVNESFEPVPGLYAAGADSCNIYDDSYMFLLPGNSMGYAVNTGRIAGMSAAEYVEI